MQNMAVEMAKDIMDMQDRLWYLEREVARLSEYEKKYNDLLNASIKHGEIMMGQMLKAMIDKS